MKTDMKIRITDASPAELASILGALAGGMNKMSRSTLEVVEAAPEAVEAAPEMAEPAPEAVEAAPEAVEDAPEAVEDAPEEAEAASEAAEPAPEEDDGLRPVERELKANANRAETASVKIGGDATATKGDLVLNEGEHVSVVRTYRGLLVVATEEGGARTVKAADCLPVATEDEPDGAEFDADAVRQLFLDASAKVSNTRALEVMAGIAGKRKIKDLEPSELSVLGTKFSTMLAEVAA